MVVELDGTGEVSLNSDDNGGATVSINTQPGNAVPRMRALIPEKFSVEIGSEGGTVELARLEGSATVSSGGGDIQLDKISEGHLFLSSAGGKPFTIRSPSTHYSLTIRLVEAL